MKRTNKQGLFHGYWFDTTTGKKLGRVKRSELAEAYRLWAIGKDIRAGVVGAGPHANEGRGGRSPGDSERRGTVAASLRERPFLSEANPFHEEGGRQQETH